jgi:SMODS and SLOG-associating 2TM effector domain 1
VLCERIQDQRVWYTRKAATNKRSARKWVAAGIAAYAIAAALAVGRVRLPDRVWPIGPVLVLASSILGWMQVKKFSELAATYTVAAHEIGLLRPKLDDVTSESELSDFVNDAELAFSREHTLWMARRTT